MAIKDGRVVRGTPDGYLLALNADTGAMLWARQVAKPAEGETFTMAPLVFEDLILIGPAGSENNVQGWVGAFRLADGSPVWRFNTVPETRRARFRDVGHLEGHSVRRRRRVDAFALDTGDRRAARRRDQSVAGSAGALATWRQSLHQLDRRARRAHRQAALAQTARARTIRTTGI